jgi:hypothetical protein
VTAQNVLSGPAFWQSATQGADGNDAAGASDAEMAGATETRGGTKWSSQAETMNSRSPSRDIRGTYTHTRGNLPSRYAYCRIRKSEGEYGVFPCKS